MCVNAQKVSGIRVFLIIREHYIRASAIELSSLSARGFGGGGAAGSARRCCRHELWRDDRPEVMERGFTRKSWRDSDFECGNLRMYYTVLSIEPPDLITGNSRSVGAALRWWGLTRKGARPVHPSVRCLNGMSGSAPVLKACDADCSFARELFNSMLFERANEQCDVMWCQR